MNRRPRVLIKTWREKLIEAQRLAEKNPTGQTKKKPKPKAQTNHPPDYWRDVIKETIIELHKSSWLQNLVVGTAFLFIALGVAVFVTSKQTGVLVVAAGLTIVLWIFAGAVYLKLGERAADLNATPPAPTPQLSLSVSLEKQGAKQDKAQETLDKILATMASYQKQHAPDLASEFPLGYSLFTMKGRTEIVPYKVPASMGAVFDWQKASVQVSNDIINLTLPDVTFAGGGWMRSCGVGILNKAGASTNALVINNTALVFKLIDTEHDERMAVLGLKPFVAPKRP